jgi:hypothetical protein
MERSFVGASSLAKPLGRQKVEDDSRDPRAVKEGTFAGLLIVVIGAVSGRLG